MKCAEDDSLTPCTEDRTQASATKGTLLNSDSVAAPPLTLYAHLPWCLRKCSYCDFNSHPVPAGAAPPFMAYADRLLEDLDRELEQPAARRPLVAIFIGGGTPSLFSGAAIRHLLAGIRARTSLAPDCEISLEANPGAADIRRFAAYREAGVNRLSIGIQSLSADGLRRLGRVHDPAAARAAVATARAAGFDNLNLDLMHGLPGQGLDAALADLEAALALAPEHLSWYQLTLEPETAFGARPPADLPDSDLAAEMAFQGQARLAAAGFDRYEISAYARPRYQCRHNLNYWRFGDYLGIGAGAHGKLTHPPGALAAPPARAGADPRAGAPCPWPRNRSPSRPRSPRGRGGSEPFLIRRAVKRPTPADWLIAAPAELVSDRQTLDAEDAIIEFALNALRLTQGFEIGLFAATTGLPWSRMAPTVTQAAAEGLLEIAGDRIRPTPLGQRFLDDLVARFIPG